MQCRKQGYYNHGMENDPYPPIRSASCSRTPSRLLRRRFEQEIRDIPMTTAQLQIVARLKRNEGIGQAGARRRCSTSSR